MADTIDRRASPTTGAGSSGGIRAAVRVAERELTFLRVAWKGVLFTFFIFPLVYLVGIGVGLGGLIEEDPASREAIGGISYLAFVAPGILVGTMAQFGAGSGMWPIMAGHRWLGYHRAMTATPIAPATIPTGLVAWIFVRTLLQAIVFLAGAAALGATGSWWALLASPIAGLAAATFAAPLMAFAAASDDDAAFDPLMRVVIAPLFLFSGAFFDVDVLPSALAAVVKVFPLWHGIELARHAMAGSPGEWPIPANLAVMVAWAVIGWLVARRTFTKRLES